MQEKCVDRRSYTEAQQRKGIGKVRRPSYSHTSIARQKHHIFVIIFWFTTLSNNLFHRCSFFLKWYNLVWSCKHDPISKHLARSSNTQWGKHAQNRHTTYEWKHEKETEWFILLCWQYMERNLIIYVYTRRNC